MLLSYEQLVDLVSTGVITGGPAGAVNSSSIDLHLGPRICIELNVNHIADYRERTGPLFREIEIPDEGYVMAPGEFILAHSAEGLHMPYDVSAMLRTKSSMGRMGFEHLDAGWVDATFDGVMTFEFKNVLRYQSLRIRPDDPVGQLVWFAHRPVPRENSYAMRGRYSGSTTVEQARKPRGE